MRERLARASHFELTMSIVGYDRARLSYHFAPFMTNSRFASEAYPRRLLWSHPSFLCVYTNIIVVTGVGPSILRFLILRILLLRSRAPPSRICSPSLVKSMMSLPLLSSFSFLSPGARPPPTLPSQLQLPTRSIFLRSYTVAA